MPGLAGVISNEPGLPLAEYKPMLDMLTYGRAIHIEDYGDSQVRLGCVHLGTYGSQAVYDSEKCCVAFYGYLTRPSIPPGGGRDGLVSAVQYVHENYLEKGENILSNLEGAYAVSIWDKRNHTLLLGSDRMGLRPLYYAEHNKTFRFASEVKSFLTDPTFPRQLDQTAAGQFFHFRYVLGERTFFENIHQLPPASYLRWKDGKWQIIRYWMVSYPESFPKRSNLWYDEHILSVLRESVRSIICPDLHYGISLSSGMDSRWIAALMGDLQPGTSAFTFQGTITSPSEAEIASRVAHLTSMDHFQVTLSPSFIADDAESIVFISDGMQSMVDAQEYPLIEEMSRQVNVAVGGFMGSGFFGQSPFYYMTSANNVFKFQKQRILSRLPPREILEQVFGRKNYGSLEKELFEDMKRTNGEVNATKGFQILGHTDIIQRQRRFTFLAQLLKTPFIEMVHPIADNRVWELSVQLPPSQLVYKRALRRALGRYYPELASLPWNKIPGPATGSIPFIFARDVAARVIPKIGALFKEKDSYRPNGHMADYPDWLRGPLRPYIEPILLSEEAYATDLLDHDGFRKAVRDYFNGQSEITAFLGVALSYILWVKMFYIPSSPSKPINLLAQYQRQSIDRKWHEEIKEV